MNRRSDHAQVFGNKRQVAQAAAQHLKQIIFGASHPMSVDRSGLSGGNLPITFKTPEMIEPDDVADGDRPRHALHPPVITAGLAHVPAVKRIAPPLPSGAECVRWNPGHHGRLEFIVKMKKVWMPPYVGAIVAHKDGHVAHDLDSALRSITAQRPPLLEESKLNGAFDFEFALVLHPEFVQGLRLTPSQFTGPGAP